MPRKGHDTDERYADRREKGEKFPEVSLNGDQVQPNLSNGVKYSNRGCFGLDGRFEAILFYNLEES